MVSVHSSFDPLHYQAILKYFIKFTAMDTMLDNFSRTGKVYREILSHILGSAVRDVLFTKNAKEFCENV